MFKLKLKQVGILTWKNLMEDFRKPLRLMIQCLVPLVVITFLVLVHAISNKKTQVADCHFKPKALPTAGMMSFFRTRLCDWDSPCLSKHQPIKTFEQLELKSFVPFKNLIALTNQNEDLRDIIIEVYHQIKSNTSFRLNKAVNILWKFKKILDNKEFKEKIGNLSEALFKDYENLSQAQNIIHFDVENNRLSKISISIYNLSVATCGKETVQAMLDNKMIPTQVVKIEDFKDELIVLDFNTNADESHSSSNTATKTAAATNTSRTNTDKAKSYDTYKIFKQIRRYYYDCVNDRSWFNLWGTPLSQFGQNYYEHFNGYILYYPNTPLVQKIIEKANSLYKPGRDTLDFIQNWKSLHKNKILTAIRDLFENKDDAEKYCNIMKKFGMFKTEDCLFLQNIKIMPIENAAEILDLVLNEVDIFISCYFSRLINPYVGFSNSTQMYSESVNFSKNRSLKAIIEFELPKNATEKNLKFATYTLRPNAWRTDHPDTLRKLIEPQNPGPRREWTNNKFTTYSFIDMQDILEWAMSEVMSTKNVVDGIQMQKMPYSCWLHDLFFVYFRSYIHMFIIISWVVIVGIMVQKIVYEKECRLKEMVLMMGVGRITIWSSWFLSIFTIFLIPNILLALLLKYTICRLVDITILIFLFTSYSVSSIVCSFFLSTLFSKANVGASLSSFIYLASYLPYALCTLVLRQSLYPVAHFLLSLVPNVAFSYAFDGMLKFDHFSVPVYWSTLNQSPYVLQNYTITRSLAMLWADTILLSIATLYIEQVYSGTSGTSKSFYFLCSWQYWKSRLKRYFPKLLNRKVEHQNLKEYESPVSIFNLCKSYGSFQVLKDFSLNLQHNQVLSLVGRNGCGKSTLLSILCGLETANSGVINVFGFDHSQEMTLIRKWIGICPQFDALFGFLTVREHVNFYGTLKYLTDEEKNGEVADIVSILKLPENTIVSELSGGQRRKLCLLLAFLGDVKFVILDEPTAGVDPQSRKSIWKIINKLKKDKTILFTSHHLDEAEALADQIAVLGTGGKIEFLDTPEKLRNMYSDAEILTVSFASNANTVNCANILTKYLNNFISHNYPISNLKLNWKLKGNDVFYQFPKEVVRNCMSDILKCLESKRLMFEVQKFSVARATLEDIFFLVTSNDSSTASETSGNSQMSNLNSHEENINNVDLGTTTVKTDEANTLSGNEAILSTNKTNIDKDDELDNKSLLRKQMETLLIKRTMYLVSSSSSLVISFLLPLLFITVAIMLIQFRPMWRESAPVEIHPWHLKQNYPNQSNSLHFFHNEPQELLNSPSPKGYYFDAINKGLHGCRCMNSSVYTLSAFQCNDDLINSKKSEYTDKSCIDCGNSCKPANFTHYMKRIPTQDILHSFLYNDTFSIVNISTWLIETNQAYFLNRFGGVTMNETDPFINGIQLYLESYEQVVNQIQNETVRNILQINSKPIMSYIEGLIGRRLTTRVWFDNNGYISSIAYLNIINNARLRNLLEDSFLDSSSTEKPSSGIRGFLYSLPPDVTAKRLDFDNFGYVIALVGVFATIAMTAFPSASICQLVEERSSGARHLQLFFTIPLSVYWLMNFIFDLLFYIVLTCVMICILHVAGGEVFAIPYNTVCTGILFLSFGFSILPFNYFLSLFFKEQSRAYIAIFIINFLVSIVTSLLYSMLFVLQQYNSDIAVLSKKIRNILLILFPQFGLAQGMHAIQSNELWGKPMNEWYSKQGYYKELLSWDMLIKNIASFSIHFCVYWILIIIVETVECLNLNLPFNRKKNSNVSISPTASIQVINVKKQYTLTMFGVIRKTLKSWLGFKTCFNEMEKKPAVDEITFTVEPGEVVGLLGSNGAGKSTIFKMLTRVTSITSGQILVQGKPNNKFSVFKNVGYCSQSNVLWKTLTPENHLKIYARAKGFAGKQLNREVDRLIHQLALVEQRYKPSFQLSGGNKRRLCVAIAFIGSPDIILLDEPSAGVDVIARRKIWECIQMSKRHNQSILLTSHSMEECEVLCDTILIMKNGRLLARGSVDELKSRFCKGYNAQFTLNVNPKDSVDSTINKIIQELTKLPSECSIIASETSKDRKHNCKLQIQTPETFGFVDLYTFVTNLKERISEIESFALIQPSIEEVFHRVMVNDDEKK